MCNKLFVPLNVMSFSYLTELSGPSAVEKHIFSISRESTGSYILIILKPCMELKGPTKSRRVYYFKTSSKKYRLFFLSEVVLAVQ